MSTETPAASEQQLQNIEKKLQEISTRLSRSALVSRVVGLVLLCLMGVYFAYGYSEIRTLTDPNYIVPMAANLVEDSIPQLRTTLHETVVTSAPAWAESLSTAGIQAAPAARERLENYILEQTSGVLDEKIDLGEEEFRKIVREHRGEMETALKQLAKDETYSKETLQIFTEALNQELGQDLDGQAHEVLGTLIGLNEKLQRLASGKQLSRDEALQRHTLMTVRHLQLREGDPAFADRIKKRVELYQEPEAKDEKPATETAPAQDTPKTDAEQKSAQVPQAAAK